MSQRYDRKRAREALLKRTQESFDRKDGEATLKYFKEDSDLPLWKCGPTKDDPHVIDIIPFRAGSNWPQLDKQRPIKEGDDVYVLELYVHSNVGPSKEMVVCPAKNYGKPCPICEDVDRDIREGLEWDDYSGKVAKRRCGYNIVCYDTKKEEDKGVQVWEVSHRYSEKVLAALAKSSRGGGLIPFACADKDLGRSISFEVADDTYRTISGHKFEPRTYDISDEILEQVYRLDDHIAILSYEQIADKFNAGASSKQESETATNKEKERTEESEGTGDTGRGRRRRQETSNENKCPHGHTFGVSIDVEPDCEKCTAYQDCADEFDRQEAERKAAAASGGRKRRDNR